MTDILNLSAELSKLGGVGVLALAVVVVGIGFIREWFVPGRSYLREVARAERALAGWEGATKQFERALDVIEKMANAN